MISGFVFQSLDNLFSQRSIRFMNSSFCSSELKKLPLSLGVSLSPRPFWWDRRNCNSIPLPGALWSCFNCLKLRREVAIIFESLSVENKDEVEETDGDNLAFATEGNCSTGNVVIVSDSIVGDSVLFFSCRCCFCSDGEQKWLVLFAMFSKLSDAANSCNETVDDDDPCPESQIKLGIVFTLWVFVLRLKTTFIGQWQILLHVVLITLWVNLMFPFH